MTSPAATVFAYEIGEPTRPKTLHRLCRTDILHTNIQIVQTEGGETNLHSHPNLDGVWFVLGGRARFYTTGDEVIAELGRHEGVLIPRMYPYWFESIGEEPLEILQFEATNDPAKVHDRIDYEPQKASASDLELIDHAGAAVDRHGM